MTLRQARLRRFWSMHQLARVSGVGVKTISEIETGETTRPRLATIERLATALGCTPHEIEWPGDPLGIHEFPTLPLATVPRFPVATSHAPPPDDAEAAALDAFWEAKYRQAEDLPEPGRTALLRAYNASRYGPSAAEIARILIREEQVVEADARATPDATPEAARQPAQRDARPDGKPESSD